MFRMKEATTFREICDSFRLVEVEDLGNKTSISVLCCKVVASSCHYNTGLDSAVCKESAPRKRVGSGPPHTEVIKMLPTWHYDLKGRE